MQRNIRGVTKQATHKQTNKELLITTQTLSVLQTTPFASKRCAVQPYLPLPAQPCIPSPACPALPTQPCQLKEAQTVLAPADKAEVGTRQGSRQGRGRTCGEASRQAGKQARKQEGMKANAEAFTCNPDPLVGGDRTS
ncbi:hypothetical protein E2C01_072868 [Portunus trituberculatus]|uniref:Uncharacterized protein n=1 Tax=Portunus trituberculatus TaxID=210409 RepID=A0A5B7I7U8_PORTR|nr:hypothetical protein [Portunus trituberculatus]